MTTFEGGYFAASYLGWLLTNFFKTLVRTLASLRQNDAESNVRQEDRFTIVPGGFKRSQNRTAAQFS
ncbi:hypothetical protein [Mesorhizobium sp.]|uniref:hypothetical protein n=1 Tax=Mesorhizobium sp. TaxID=1871066 RepID=UPI0025F24BC9|nr:hypothetical protein [Mesorhizobium sp.]